MTTPRQLADVLSEFALIVADGGTVSEILHCLGEYCTELLPVHGAGVLLANADAQLRFATASDELGRHVEQLEEQLGEGPCTDSYRRGEQVNVPDLRHTTSQYRRFAPAALQVGIRGIHALPMSLRGQRLGVLDLVSREPLNLSGSQLSIAQLLADVSMAYVVNSRAYQESSRLADQLQRALDSRVVIEQAKGILAERLDTTVTDAFELLRRHSRRHGRKLHDVAHEVIDGTLRLDAADQPGGR